MIRNNCLGYSLPDESKEISSGNKIIAKSIEFFHTCKCGKETMLNSNMFTDDCEDRGYSFTGWKYTCTCGKDNQVWEGAFDSYMDNLYDNDLVEYDEDDD